MNMCGGMSGAKVMTPEMFSKFVSLKPAIQIKAGKTYTVFEPISFKSQVVAGTNYVAKIKVDGEKCIHAKMFEPLPYTGDPISVTSVEVDKQIGDAL